MNLKQLEAFALVAECGSFSKAAKRLYLTQPTVSAHVGALEQELKCRLFVRGSKGIILSAEGELLYGKARQILDLERQIRQDFSVRSRTVQDRILVGASTVPGQYVLPVFLPQFCRAYPDIQISVQEGDSESVARMVGNGGIEVGFTGSACEVPNCVFEPFLDDELVIITPATDRYRRLEEGKFPLGQLYEEALIVREEGSGTRREAERYLAAEGIDVARIPVAATIQNQETIKKSVSNGLGISILSASAAQDYVDQGKLLRFSMKEGGIFRKIYLVWSSRQKPREAARRLIRFVEESYRL